MQKSDIKKEIVCCRWAPSLGQLESTHQKVWGTKSYGGDDLDKPTVFFGLYGLNDFFALWRHRGKKWILWAGSDIQHFLAGYWLDEEGKIRIHPTQISSWIDTYCESYVENEVEKSALASVGIRSKVVPSFLGDVKKFKISYGNWGKPRLYTSVSGDNFKLYGWDKIPELARKHPDIEFHLYGSEHQYAKDLASIPNVINHGRVPKERMNEEIREMQGALRLTEFDGFSEILAKSILMGQYPVSNIEYKHMLTPATMNLLSLANEPNIAGRYHYLALINNFPWNTKRHV